MPLKFTPPLLIEDKITGKENRLKLVSLPDNTVFKILNKNTGLTSTFLWWQVRHFFGPEIENKILKSPNRTIFFNHLVIDKQKENKSHEKL